MAKIENIALCANNLNRLGNFRSQANMINDFLESTEAKFFLFCDDFPAIWKSESIELRALNYSQIANLNTDIDIAFAGIDEKQAPYFLVAIKRENQEYVQNVLSCEFAPLRSILMAIDDFTSSVLALGVSIFGWHKTHQYCAKCGAKTKFTDFGFKRICASCDAEHFPRTDPVAIMLVIHNDKCLFARSKQFPDGLLSLPAGFVEPGESIEQACAREVFEEMGIEISDAELLASQPWPNYSQIMIGLKANAINENITLDENEMEYACWLNKSQTRQLLTKDGFIIDGQQFWGPRPAAIAYSLIKYWLNEKI